MQLIRLNNIFEACHSWPFYTFRYIFFSANKKKDNSADLLKKKMPSTNILLDTQQTFYWTLKLKISIHFISSLFYK